MVAFTLLMGISLTSCLNSDNDYVQQIPVIAKVQSSMFGYTFKTSDGYSITPTAASVASCESAGYKLSALEGKVSYILYTADGLELNETNKTLDGVTLLGAISLDNAAELVQGTKADKLHNDSIENTPIISLEDNNMKPYFFDNTTIMLPVQYIVKKSSNFVSLVYYAGDEEDNGDVLRLHLRYNATGKDVNSTATSYEYYSQAGAVGLYLRAYDLENIFVSYLHKKGLTPSPVNYPTTIEIVANVNSYSTDLTDNQTEEKVFVVTKKEAEK